MIDITDEFVFKKTPEGYKSGYVAIVGRPNAGKSTLINAILGSKLSIITPKVQTTRHRITGVHSEERGQIVFLDTPGILEPKYKLHETMMKAVNRSLDDADIILLIIDPKDLLSDTELEWLRKKIHKPLFLLINKVDIYSLSERESVQEMVKASLNISTVSYISALNLTGVKEVIDEVFERLPEGPPFYPPDQLSEHPERFFAAELIREQLFLLYHAEIPYSCAVNIIQFDRKENIDVIDAEIVVNRKSQKGILIGKAGSALKKMGTEARKSIEEFTGNKAFLNIHVKVREKWRDKDSFLREYGYD